jgi:hypothetical protein
VNNSEFYRYLGAGADRVVGLEHVWQYALAIKACPDELVQALTVANPRIAAEFARQEAMYEALNAPNPLHAAVAAAPDDAQALAFIEAESADVRAEYANDLALGEYDQEQLCGQYRALVLGES